MGKKIVSVLIIAILCVFPALFSWLFYNCLNFYHSFDVQYDELICEELTFDKYEIIVRIKSGDLYEIYFEEYDEPFEVSNITQNKLDKKVLKSLEQSTIINVYYRETDSRKYNYEICEMKVNSVEILRLTDYVKVNQNNQILGMIVCPILAISGVFIIIYFIKMNLA